MDPQSPHDDRTMSDPKQLRAINSPIRNAIHTVVLNQKRASIRKIANQLGMKPASLYRHIEVLLEAGVITEEGTESTARRDAKVYASNLEHIDDQHMSPAMLEAFSGFIRQAMKTSAERIIGAASSGDAATRGTKRNTCWRSPFSWLDDQQLKQLNDHIDAIMALMNNNERRDGTRLIGLTLGMYPMPITENTEDRAED